MARIFAARRRVQRLDGVRGVDDLPNGLGKRKKTGSPDPNSGAGPGDGGIFFAPIAGFEDIEGLQTSVSVLCPHLDRIYGSVGQKCKS